MLDIFWTDLEYLDLASSSSIASSTGTIINYKDYKCSLSTLLKEVWQKLYTVKSYTQSYVNMSMNKLLYSKFMSI